MKNTEFAFSIAQTVQSKAIEKVKAAIEMPDTLNLEQLRAERARIRDLAASDFAPVDEIETEIGGVQGHSLDSLYAWLDRIVSDRVDELGKKVIEDLSANSGIPSFVEFKKSVDSIVAQISDGTPNGDRDARERVADLLNSGASTTLSKPKRMLVSLVVHDLLN